MVNTLEFYKHNQKAYIEWSGNNQAEFNLLPIRFAYGAEQEKEMFERWGLDISNKKDLKKVIRVCDNGYMLKRDKWQLNDYLKQDNGIDSFKRNYGLDALKGAIWYELFNHELEYNDDIYFDLNNIFYFTDEEKKIYNEVLQDAYNYCEEA